MIKQVAVFNDISGFGNCSLAAALPVLSVLGIQCNPIPTMTLTGQGGYKVAYRKDLTDMLPLYTTAWTANHASFTGIYSGYLTGPEQIESVFDFLAQFRKEQTFLLVDPVMGDNGHTYQIYSPKLLDGMKRLSRQADLITPNLTEACLLADVPPEELFSDIEDANRLEQVTQIARKLRALADRPQDVVITGVVTHSPQGSSVSNVACTQDGIYISSSPWYEKSYSGTGDLFASAMCGLRLNGYSTPQAMDITANFLHHSLTDEAAASVDKNNGIPFQRHLKELITYVK